MIGYNFRGLKIDSGVCSNGCAGCKHYPYFHYIPHPNGDDIENIRTLSFTKVINHTKNVTHVYNGETWIKD